MLTPSMQEWWLQDIQQIDGARKKHFSSMVVLRKFFGEEMKASTVPL
jgi:hypothetical protein